MLEHMRNAKNNETISSYEEYKEIVKKWYQ
jgi:hypothetical protein